MEVRAQILALTSWVLSNRRCSPDVYSKPSGHSLPSLHLKKQRASYHDQILLLLSLWRLWAFQSITTWFSFLFSIVFGKSIVSTSRSLANRAFRIMATLSSLPLEITREILQYLPIKSLLHFGLTSHSNHAIQTGSLSSLRLGVFHSRLSGK